LSKARPADLEAIVRDLAAAESVAAELCAGLTDAQLNWSPDDGLAWSIAQCLDHVVVTDTVYLKALRDGLAQAGPISREGPIAPGFLGRFFIRGLEPPVKKRFRFKAARKIKPAARRSREEVLAAFHNSHDSLCRFIDECAALDLNHVTFPNPFIPGVRMGVGTGLLVIAAHQRRHLWQARNVRERADLPAAS
jgi:hypothetical protein